MKKLLLTILTLFAFSRASAQASNDPIDDQREFYSFYVTKNYSYDYKEKMDVSPDYGVWGWNYYDTGDNQVAYAGGELLLGGNAGRFRILHFSFYDYNVHYYNYDDCVPFINNILEVLADYDSSPLILVPQTEYFQTQERTDRPTINVTMTYWPSVGYPIDYSEYKVEKENLYKEVEAFYWGDEYIKKWQYSIDGGTTWKDCTGDTRGRILKFGKNTVQGDDAENLFGKTFKVRFVTKFFDERGRAGYPSEEITFEKQKFPIPQYKDSFLKDCENKCYIYKREAGDIVECFNEPFNVLEDGEVITVPGGVYNLYRYYSKVDIHQQIPEIVPIQLYDNLVLSGNSTNSYAECPTGTVTLTATGGKGIIQYSKDNVNFVTSNVFSNIPAGDNTFYAKDEYGCVSSYTVNVPSYAAFTISNQQVNHAQCFNGTGCLTLSCSGGGGTALYARLTGNSKNESKLVSNGTVIFSDLPAGTYNIKLYNNEACGKEFAYTITQPEALKLQKMSLEKSLCYGGTSKITFNVSGGNSPYSYKVDGGSPKSISSATFSEQIKLSEGIKTYVAEDKNRCPSNEVKIEDLDPTSLSLTIKSSTGVKKEISENEYAIEGCDTPDGTVRIVMGAAGGSGSYTLKKNGETAALNADLILAPSSEKYVLEVSDNNGCPVVKTIYVRVLSKVAANLVGSTNSCNGKNGTITLNVSAGSGNYTFYNRTNSLTATEESGKYILSQLASGTYNISVNDGYCSSSEKQVTLYPGVTFAASSDMDCSKEKSDITITGLSGGDNTYTYTLKNGAGEDINTPVIGGKIANLNSGAYTLAVTSAGCTTTSPKINVYNRPVVKTFSISTPACPGSNASFTYEVVEGKTPSVSYLYTFTNQNGQQVEQSGTLTGLSGTRSDLLAYSGELKLNVNECNISTEAIPVSIPQLAVQKVEVPQWNCKTTEKGHVNVTVISSSHYSSYQVSLYRVEGGTPTLVKTKQSVTGTDTYNFEVDTPGKYMAKVESGTCSDESNTVDVSPQSAMTIANVTIKDPLCYNDKGTVAITVDNPTGKLTGQGSFSVNGNVLTYTADHGTRTYTISDGYCALITANQTINNPAEITFNTALSNPLCNGNNAKVVFQGVQPAGSYTYVVNNTEYGTPTISIPSPANETELLLKVKNDKGCYSGEVKKVVGTPDKLVGSYSVEPVRCYAESNGSIILGATGGTLPYSFYSVTDGVETKINASSISSLLANSYNVKVVDNNGCTDEQTVAVAEPDMFKFTATPQSPVCRDGNNGIINLSITGGNGGAISYLLNSGAESPLSGTAISNLTAGTYNIKLTDSKGCIANQQGVEVQNPALWAWDVSTLNPTCSDNGTITINSITGGYGEYKLVSNGNSALLPIGNLGVGSYKLAVKDKNQCGQSYTVSLSENKMQTSHTEKHVTCYGGNDGEIVVNTTKGRINGAYHITLTSEGKQQVGQGNADNSRVTFKDLKAGSYELSVSDNSGCSYAKTIPITQYETPITFTEKITEAATCKEMGAIEIKDVSGYQGEVSSLIYTVSAATQVGNPLFSVRTGKHLIRVTDEKGCSAKKDVVVSPEILTATIQVTPMDCSGNNNGAVEITQLTGGIGQLSVACLPQSASEPDDAGYGIAMRYENLTPGDYIIYGRDENNRCKMVVDNFTIKDVQPLKLAYNNTPPSCSGHADGSAAIQVTGGNGSYQLSIGGVLVPVGDDGYATHSSLSAGSYPILLTDKNACPNRGVQELVMAQPDPITLAVESVTDVKCNAEGNGLVLLKAAGGNGSYVFSTKKDGALYRKDNNQNAGYLLENLVPGVYSFDVTDKKGCPLSANAGSVTINEPAPLTLSISSFKDLSCFENSSGEIIVQPEGGNTGTCIYRINQADEQQSATFKGLAAGNHTIYVKDSKGCETQVSRTLTQPALLSLDNLNIQSPLCYGQKGSITPTLSGGTQPYSICIENATSNIEPSKVELAKGSYTLSYTDANGCNFAHPFSMKEPELLTINETIARPLCNGLSGTVTLLAAGGTPAYSYSFNGVESKDGTFTAGKGLYNAQITDLNGCVVTKSIDVTEPETLTFAQSYTTPLCNGLTGSITLNGNGGTSPYTYTIGYTNRFPSEGNLVAEKGGGVSFIGVKPGSSYLPAIMDKNGCITTGSSIDMQEPSLLQWDKNSTIDIKCFGDATGSAVLSAKGGTQPYTYLLGESNSVTGTYNTLKSGVYNAKTTDANGCTIQRTITIAEPSLLKDNALMIPQRCFTACDGRISLSPTGGVAPYFISWNKPEFGSNTLLSNLCGGSYLLSITDANGCSLSRDLSFETPEEILVNIGFKDTTLCRGNSVLVTPKPARYGFTWLKDGAFITNGGSYLVNTTGSYTLKASDSKGCFVDFDFNVQVLSEEMNSDFLVTSKAAAGDTVVFVNISSPKPVKTEWKYGPEARVVAVEESYISLVYDNPGTYVVGLKAYNAGCATSVEKQIVVGAKDDKFDIDKSLGYKESIVKSFKAYPNPSTGDFKVSIELSKRNDATLNLLNISKGTLVETKRLSGDVTYEVQFNRADLIQGFYALNLIVNDESVSIKIVKL